MNLIEKKKHVKPYYCKRLFKLVFVLFKLQKEIPENEIWRQLQMQKEEDDDNASQENSSILGGQLSDINSNFIRMNEKYNATADGDLINENDLESNYSNSKFKTANANLFSINSQNDERGHSMSPKGNNTIGGTKDTNLRYHSGLN